MATQPSSPVSDADTVLEQFVFGHDPFRSEAIPRGLAPEQVAGFVRERVGKSTELGAVRQTEKLIDFYDVHETAEVFSSFLDRREVTEEETHRSVLFARAVARVGLPANRDFVAGYYPSLLRRAGSAAVLDDAVGLYEALGPNADVAPVRTRIQQRLELLAERYGTDPEAKYESQKLTDLDSFTLHRAAQADAQKAAVLKNLNRQARITQEIRMYLGIQYGYLEYLQPWGARRLRREVWGDQPDQQIQRVDDAGRRAELVEIFRRTMANLGAMERLQPEERQHATIRCLRAIEFFGGELSPEEQGRLKEEGAGQVDVLWNGQVG